MAFFEKYKDGCLLRIKLSPGSSFNGFRGIFTDEAGLVYLKAAVTAAPEKGKANTALLRLLAKALSVTRSSLRLISGETDRMKKIYLKIPVTNETEEKLNSLLKE